jgi:hypothetical protein
MATVAGVRSNPTIRTFYLRLRTNGKHAKPALIACMRKFLVILNAMLHDKTRIRDYLHSRGIPDAIIDRYFLGWNGSRITIPVFNEKRVCAFFRLTKDPDDASDASKRLSP